MPTRRETTQERHTSIQSGMWGESQQARTFITFIVLEQFCVLLQHYVWSFLDKHRQMIILFYLSTFNIGHQFALYQNSCDDDCLVFHSHCIIRIKVRLCHNHLVHFVPVANLRPQRQIRCLACYRRQCVLDDDGYCSPSQVHCFSTP